MLTYEPGEQARVAYLSADGGRLTLFGGGGAHHELRWSGADGRTIVVQRFTTDQREAQVYGAAFDGRYLAYSVVWHYRGWDDWTVYVWDSHGQAAPIRVADNTRGADGVPLPSPLPYIVIYRGLVVWTQRTGADPNDWEQTEIRSYRVDGGHRATLAVGHHTYPQLIGSMVVWRESPTPGALAELRAISLETGEPVGLPGPLAGLVGVSYLASEGDTTAWIMSDLKAVWVWRAGWPEPVVAYRSSAEVIYVEWVAVTGDFVTWNHRERGQYVLDLRSGGYARVTPEWGGLTTGGGMIAVMRQPESSETREAVLDTRALPPLPGC
jgi:hypothetical protein